MTDENVRKLNSDFMWDSLTTEYPIYDTKKYLITNL